MSKNLLHFFTSFILLIIKFLNFLGCINLNFVKKKLFYYTFAFIYISKIIVIEQMKIREDIEDLNSFQTHFLCPL